MKNKTKTFLGFLSLILLGFIITGCTNQVALENDNAVVSFNGLEITSDELYQELKSRHGISILVDMIDYKLFGDLFPLDEEQNREIDEQILQFRAMSGDNEEAFINAIRASFGVDNEDALRRILTLEYKRNLAVIDYLKEDVSTGQVKSYYNEFISGSITARHILISPEVTSDMSSEEVRIAEREAFEKAERIIRQIDLNEDNFGELAENYSDDPGSASIGGALIEFDHNSNMDADFFKAARDLNVGEYTVVPVKSQFGYHIILKENETDMPDLENVEDFIRQTLAEEMLGNDHTLYFRSLKSIRENNNISFIDTILRDAYEQLMTDLINNAFN